MKKFGDFGKKGVSAVVATVLIIMITVAAVAILWITVIPVIENSLESSTAEKVQLEIVTSEGYTVWDEVNGIVGVQVKRGSDNLNLTGIQFNFFGDGKTQQNISEIVLLSGLTKVFEFELIEITNLESISIAPIFKEGIGAISSTTSPVKEAVNIKRTFQQSCVSGLGCISGYCINGKCTNETGLVSVVSGCSEDSECIQGICDPNGACSDGSVDDDCHDDYDCNSPFFCDTRGTFITNECLDSSTPLAKGYSCYEDNQCISGICLGNDYYCSAGEIGDVCSEEDDCKSPNVCDYYIMRCVAP
jgi:flagellin-like protein